MSAAISAIIFSLNAIAQPAEPANTISENGYEVTGILKGLNDGDKVVAVLTFTQSWTMERTDSAFVKDGVFHLKGTVPNGPRLYFISFAGKKRMRLTIANNEHITLSEVLVGILFINDSTLT